MKLKPAIAAILSATALLASSSAFAALSHLARYCAQGLPHPYKTTRNALSGFDHSSRWSPWMASGALSAEDEAAGEAAIADRDYVEHCAVTNEVWRDWLAKELGRDGITVNAVGSNYVENPDYFPPALLANREAMAKMTAQIPLGRLGKSDELGATVCFLCSDGAGFITGHVLPHAGGWA